MTLPTDLPAQLRGAGLTVVTVDGWQARGRPATAGGFAPVGVLWHHTGDKRDGLAYARWLFLTGRQDLPAPLCQLSVGRDGTVYLGAAGRANHAGKARASGPVAAGDGNRLYVGIECHNNGSEGWTPTQYAAMVRLGAALSDVLGCSADAHRGHRETSVTGKWDPGLLDMEVLRADIRHKISSTRAPARSADVEAAITAQTAAITAAKKVRDRAIREDRPTLLGRARAAIKRARESRADLRKVEKK